MHAWLDGLTFVALAHQVFDRTHQPLDALFQSLQAPVQITVQVFLFASPTVAGVLGAATILTLAFAHALHGALHDVGGVQVADLARRLPSHLEAVQDALGWTALLVRMVLAGALGARFVSPSTRAMLSLLCHPPREWLLAVRAATVVPVVAVGLAASQHTGDEAEQDAGEPRGRWCGARWHEGLGGWGRARG